MKSILIKNGRVIDPASGRDEVTSVLIRDGFVATIGSVDTQADVEIDASEMIVAPGLIDMRVSLREPGNEEDETIESGTSAALAGGFSTIACMPDTEPPVDTRAAAEFVILQADRAGNCRVVPIGAVTKQLAGQELAEIGQLVDGGARAFSDAKQPIASAEVMRRALEYTAMMKRPILHHPQVPELVAGGLMHEGYYSTLMGMPPMPAAAETIMIHRDLTLAEMTSGRLHLMGISTGEGVEQIRRARERGVQVTADVTPHHLFFRDEHLQTFHSKYKVNPPFRTEADTECLIEGLKDGTIDVITSDHQPYAEEKITCELDQTPFGVVGLETLVPACITRLINTGILSWPELLAKLTVHPARILELDSGVLDVDRVADITVIDPRPTVKISPPSFRSKGRRTPFADMELSGKIAHVLVGGEVRYSGA